MNPKLKLALPKGSLQESTFEMMARAGFHVKVGNRSYVPTVDDPEIEARLIRAQEISRYVELGAIDAGLTGLDWVTENNSDVVEAANLIYAKQGLRPVKWVLAVPNDSPIRSVKDLEGKRIATEAVNITRRYLEKNGVKAEVEFSWGATEVKAPELVDAICELTETGSSLRANNLRILEVIMESTTRFIVNKKAWQDPWKRRKVETIAMLLKGALAAEEKVGLKMNVREEQVVTITQTLPALRTPTISKLSQEGWVALEVIVDERVVREIIPALRAAGAEGIIEYPLNKVIL